MCGSRGGGPVYVPQEQKKVNASSAEVEAALAKERELQRRRKGRQSTILTSGMDLDTGQKKTLLGQ